MKLPTLEETVAYKNFCWKLFRPMPEELRAKYLGLKLFAETGEFLGKISAAKFHHKENRNDIIDEAGDCLWYWFNLHTLYKREIFISCLIPLIHNEEAFYKRLTELADKSAAIFYDCAMWHTAAWTKLRCYMASYLSVLNYLSIDLTEVMQYNTTKLQLRLPKGEYNEKDFNTLNRN